MSEDIEGIVETEARRLLGLAGATIEVADDAPLRLTGLPEPDGPTAARWLAVVAAVLVLIVAGSAWALSRQAGQTPAPAPRPAGDPVEQEHVFAQDQMPSYLGLDRAAAKADLDARRIEHVAIEAEPSCAPPGLVAMTDPAPGAPLPSDQPATILVTTAPPAGLCAVGHRTQSWELLRFARGLGAPPPLAARVELSIAGGPRVSTDGSALADPEADAWTVCDEECHAAPALLRELATRTWRLDGQVVGARVLSSSAVDCGGVQGGNVMTVGAGVTACPGVGLWWSVDERGLIDAIAMSLHEDAGDVPVPQVAPTPARRASAERFLDWARTGSTPPDFADRVRNFVPGFAPPWNENPSSRSGWSGCSGLGFPDCGIDPVAAVLQEKRPMVAAAGAVVCAWTSAAERALPARFDVADDVVRLQVEGVTGCGDGAVVELWIDETGTIYAARLVALASQ
ncbi:hypothetical protein ASE01_04840 [Nocardioides sp. Root190]|uniref:PASTA domain-containing protein n=1 Tax=Nocardioides sp. Root190 TaxID=1736488 RepID=UPI0006FD368D|nr:PASTA domain-containing protein [Nocardioides sp. Root190]KRB78586.1 hypothetical protein ASE01_04840 [Nocardioides sp. Root190]